MRLASTLGPVRLGGGAASGGLRSVALPGSSDFTTLSAGQPTLPAGWACVQASDGSTVQTSQSTLVLCASGSNKARAGRAHSAHAIGLVIEPAITNLVAALNSTYPRNIAGWNASGSGADSYSTVAYAGPDGAVSANSIRDQVTSGGYSKGVFATGVTSRVRTSSIWLRSGTPGGSIQWLAGLNTGKIVAESIPATTTWTRRALTPAAADTAWLIRGADGRDLTSLGGTTAGARDMAIDFAQVEDLPYATEVSLLTGARAASYFTRAMATLCDPSGRMALVIEGRLKTGIANLTSAYPWYVDATHHVQIQANGFVKVTLGGSSYTTPLAAVGDALDRYRLTVIVGNCVPQVYWGRAAWNATLGTDGPMIETAIGLPTSSAIDAIAAPTSGSCAIGGTDGAWASWLYSVTGYRATWSAS